MKGFENLCSCFLKSSSGFSTWPVRIPWGLQLFWMKLAIVLERHEPCCPFGLRHAFNTGIRHRLTASAIINSHKVGLCLEGSNVLACPYILSKADWYLCSKLTIKGTLPKRISTKANKFWCSSLALLHVCSNDDVSFPLFFAEIMQEWSCASKKKKK